MLTSSPRELDAAPRLPMAVEPGPAVADFDRFVIDHGAALVAFARRLTLDHHRAEDLVQDVLARLALSWSRIDHHEDLRAYATKAVLRAFLSWRRRLSSREHVGLPVWEHPIGHDRAVEDLVLDRREVAAMLARVRPVQRAVLVMRYHHDLSDSDIADLLGCREATVRSHARRALESLRAHAEHQRRGRP